MLAPLLTAFLLAVPDSVPPVKSASDLRVPIARATRRPVIDGRLDDSVWAAAPRLEGFTQYEPVDRQWPVARSEAWVAYDEDHLYVAFRAYERNPDDVRATIHARERGGDLDDKVAISVDPFHERRRIYVFRVNPYGIQEDGVKVEGQQTDNTPDFVWYSAGRIDAEGWTVEVAIPFSSLRFPRGERLDFGFDLVRYNGKAGTRDSWSTRRRGNPCDICQQGTLLGLAGVRANQNVDLLPYVAALRNGARAYRTDSMFVGGDLLPVNRPQSFDVTTPEANIGGDVKWSITPSAVLNATVNPDFSQVEADEDQIRTNQRFALFFQERRPFFLEGRDAFETARADDGGLRNAAGEQLYTRSIVEPTGGVRFTAQRGNLSVGTLYARDERPAFFWYDGYESGGYVSNLPGRAEVLVAHARRNFSDNSYVGISTLGRTLGDAWDGVAAGDVFLRRGSFTFVAEGGGSMEKAPFDTVLSDVLDGQRHEGGYYRARLIRTGRTLSWSAGASGASGGFRNQLGRLGRVSTEAYSARAELQQYPNNRVLLRMEEGLSAHRTNAWGGGLLDWEVRPRIEFEFRGRTTLSANFTAEHLTIEGVGLDLMGPGLDFSVNRWERVSLGGNLFAGDREIVDASDPRVGKGVSGSFRVTLRPVPQGTLEARAQRSNHYEAWGGAMVDDAMIFRLRGTWQFTRAFGARVIGEYSDQKQTGTSNPLDERVRRLSSSLLFTYELGPSSFLYAGYNDAEQMFDTPAVSSRQLVRTGNSAFVKMSYLVRM